MSHSPGRHDFAEDKTSTTDGVERKLWVHFSWAYAARLQKAFPSVRACVISLSQTEPNAAEDQQFPDASFLRFGRDKSHTRRHVFLALSEVSFAPFVQVQGSDFGESTHGGETWRNPTQSDVAGIYFRMAVWVSGHDRSSLCPVHCKTNESQNRVNSSLNYGVFLCLTKVI